MVRMHREDEGEQAARRRPRTLSHTLPAELSWSQALFFGVLPKLPYSKQQAIHKVLTQYSSRQAPKLRKPELVTGDGGHLRCTSALTRG